MTFHSAGGPAPSPLRVLAWYARQTSAVCWISAGSWRDESGVEAVEIRQPSS